MANVRLQDLGENWKQEPNDNYALTFNGSGEAKIRLRDLYYSMVPDGAAAHNNVFRGQNLGALTPTHITNIQNGTFRDMFIGDYFSINGSNYVIAGINYKRGHGDNISLGNHLLLMPDRFSKLDDGTVLRPNGKDTHYMNDTDTTAGGFANTKLYKTYMPSIQRKLEADFGSHLLNFRQVVSTHVDADGAPDQGEWRDAKVGIPDEPMVYGTILNGNNKNNAWYNVGDDTMQLPLFRLNPEERNNYRDVAFWLRDIHSASEFASTGTYGDAYWGVASYTWFSVRAFFLIG